MNIVQAWESALRILMPSNLKLFCLVTLKSVVRVYRVLFRDFWWLLLLGAGLMQVVPTLSLYIVHPLIALAMYLIARPSVHDKGYIYYRSCLRHCAWLFPILLGISFFGRYSAAEDEVSFLLSATIIFFFLFVLDSRAGMQDVLMSGVRAVKMTVFSLPFCVVTVLFFSYLFYAVLNWIIYPVFESMLDVLPSSLFLWGSYIGNAQFILLLLFPIPLCFFTNFYIKKLHEQFVLYHS